MRAIMESFRDGGWGMFPTLIFGLMLVGVAARYAREPDRRWMPLLLGLGVLTMCMGALGFVSGLMVTIAAVTREAPHMAQSQSALMSMEGFRESMNNIGLALTMVTVAAMATCLGAWKLSNQTRRTTTLPAE